MRRCNDVYEIVTVYYPTGCVNTTRTTTSTSTTLAPTTTTTSSSSTSTSTTAIPTTTTTSSTSTSTSTSSTTTTSTTAAPNTFNVTNNGSGNYVINGQSNPTLSITEGQTYTFNISATGHPFWINTVNSTGTGNAYNDGVTNNGTANGTRFKQRTTVK